MRSTQRWLLVSLACGVFSTAASAACDYYISPSGSDSSGKGTSSLPWKTINFASAKLKAGQTLCARGGTYKGQGGYIWHSSGTASAPVTFRNAPGEVPVFDGEWGDTGVDGDFLRFSNNSNVVLDGITMQHFLDSAGNGTVNLSNSLGPVDNIVIQNCTFMDNGSDTARDHHIYLAAGPTNTTIRNNLFIRAAGSAVQANHTPAPSGILIYNNVMIGGTLKCSQSKSSPCSSTAKQSWGIMISDAKNVKIYNNTIYGMSRDGIDFDYGTTGTGPYTLRNNLLVNNASSGIRVNTLYASAFTSDYNDFYGNGVDVSWKGSNMTRSQFASSTANDLHSLTVNPAFVSAGSNFHLTSASPVINKGTTSGAPTTDFDGTGRALDGGVDMGAYEFVALLTFAPPVFSTTYSALKAYDSGCTGNPALSVACNNAILGFCKAKGYGAGGFGPVEHIGDTAVVACVKTGQASLFSTSWSELNKLHSYCNSSVPMGTECGAAINRFCHNMNYQAGGFGPYVSSSGAVSVSCVTSSEADYRIDSSWANLNAQGLGCNNQAVGSWDVCKASISRYCRSIKSASGSYYVTGFGVLEMNPTNNAVAYSCLKY